MKLKYLLIALLVIIALPIILTIISIVARIIGFIILGLVGVAIWKMFHRLHTRQSASEL